MIVVSRGGRAVFVRRQYAAHSSLRAACPIIPQLRTQSWRVEGLEARGLAPNALTRAKAHAQPDDDDRSTCTTWSVTVASALPDREHAAACTGATRRVVHAPAGVGPTV